MKKGLEPRMDANEREFFNSVEFDGVRCRFLIPSNSRGLDGFNRVGSDTIGKYDEFATIRKF